MRRLAIVLVIVFAIVTLLNVYSNSPTDFSVNNAGELKTTSVGAGS